MTDDPARDLDGGGARRSHGAGRGSDCPSCGEPVGWRNAAARCLDCAREYCRSCPDYGAGWMTNVCPDCGSGRARIL